VAFSAAIVSSSSLGARYPWVRVRVWGAGHSCPLSSASAERQLHKIT
jgi:hypothetical protein